MLTQGAWVPEWPREVQGSPPGLGGSRGLGAAMAYTLELMDLLAVGKMGLVSDAFHEVSKGRPTGTD